MAGAARIGKLALEPTKAVFHQINGSQPGRAALAGSGVVPSQQQHQGRRQLLGGTPGSLALERMPISITEGELTLKNHGLPMGALGPAAAGHWTFNLTSHWTFGRRLVHPGTSSPWLGLPMPTRAKPIRLLHLLDGLLAQGAVSAQGSGVVQRRQRQRLALTQRLLDPLPHQLSPQNRSEVLLWRGLRWGTAGLLLAWWLKN